MGCAILTCFASGGLTSLKASILPVFSSGLVNTLAGDRLDKAVMLTPMYAQYFGLKQAPFSIAPDPRYLFMSERHREALAHLLYGLKAGGGFVLLSGEIGAGKTTVCRCFLEQIPSRCNVGYIFNPKLTVEELLRSICEEFRIPYQHEGPGQPSCKDYVDALNEFLLRTHAVGQNNVLIIDEAQNLSADVLEQLRLLTNLETHERKLLQIILIGQPELRSMVAQPELEQLAQRVIARFHLQALSESETVKYIRHRLSVAGLSRPNPFDKATMRRIHALSRGVPRRINLLCDRALLGAYGKGKEHVDLDIIEHAASEVFDSSPAKSGWQGWMQRARPHAKLLASTAVALFAVAAWWLWPDKKPSVHAAASHAVTGAVTPASQGSVVARTPKPAPLPLVNLDLQTGFKAPNHKEEQGLQELGQLWKIKLSAIEPCPSAQQQSLPCFKGHTDSVTLLRQLDRPALLTLFDANNQAAYAALVGFDAQSATLQMGGQTQRVSLLSLAPAWRGDYTVLWRAPSGYSTAKTPETTATFNAWLDTQLGKLDGRASAAQPSLKARVRAFQISQGLHADGVAGPITLMHLNRATGVDEPHLHSDKHSEK